MEGFIRPEAIVLSDNAVIPERNLIVPAPNQFTHELTRSQPFYFDRAVQGDTPAGEFPAGTKVVLLVHYGGEVCGVVDGRGLYVETAYAGLRRL